MSDDGDDFYPDQDNIIQFVSKKDKEDALDPVEGKLFIVSIYFVGGGGESLDIQCHFMGFNPFTCLYTFYENAPERGVRATHMVALDVIQYMTIAEAEYES